MQEKGTDECRASEMLFQSHCLLNINPLNAELNPIRHLLALAGVHHFVQFSGVRVKH